MKCGLQATIAPRVSGLPYRLSVCGKSELSQFAGRGVTHLLSLEDPDVPKETPDWHTGPHAQLRFHDLVRAGPPRPDRVAPTREDARTILEVGARCLEAARERRLHLLVHCHAGSSRSGAAGYLLLAQALGPGREAEALRRLCELRPAALPNPLLVGFGDELLGRDGALVRAAAPLLEAVDEIMDLLAPPGGG